MKKRIIICCDGTWNEPETLRDEHIVPTNVLKMVRAIEPRDTFSSIEQVVFYDQGIGTGALGMVDRNIGGGTGYGISTNIRDCYNFLCNNFSEGDDIYLFGFSRGAYTVRSLSGMIEAVGLLEKTDLGFVPMIYEYYHTAPDQREQSKYHTMIKDLPRRSTRIKFIGVWDTVGALGAPIPVLGKVQKFLGKFIKSMRVGFHDCNLSEIVDNAFQALAIDERRGPFAPSIWDKKQESQNVQQVWFAGVHSNVGGGYEDDGLSDVAMEWMVARATEHGLLFDEEYMQTHVQAKPLAKQEDSFTFGYKALQLANVKPHERQIGNHLEMGEMIHDSVVARINSNITPAYRPKNLMGEKQQLNVSEESGQSYLDLEGIRIPVHKERKSLRHQVENIHGKVTLDGTAAVQCHILNHTQKQGARLMLEQPVAQGVSGKLDSVITGIVNIIVVWSSKNEIGVRFV